MIQWESVHHQIAITGQVTDARTGQAINRAQVSITTAPQAFTDWLTIRAKQYGERWATLLERPDRTLTAADGHFHFLDLPDGSYTLSALLPGSGSRYGTAQANATVSRHANGKITMTVAAIALPPTTLEGQITGQNHVPVVMAEIRISDSGESAFSDSQGRFRLLAVEAGKRKVLVSAQGYQPLSQTVQLNEAGERQMLDVAMTPS